MNRTRNKDLFARAFSLTLVVPRGGLSMVFQLEVCIFSAAQEARMVHRSRQVPENFIFSSYVKVSILVACTMQLLLGNYGKKPTMPAFVIQLCNFLQPILHSVVWL